MWVQWGQKLHYLSLALVAKTTMLGPASFGMPLLFRLSSQYADFLENKENIDGCRRSWPSVLIMTRSTEGDTAATAAWDSL